jgi:hypothetical protein
MKCFIITHEGNLEFAQETQEHFKKIDIDTELVVGATIDNQKYKRCEVVMWTWVEVLLPKCIECKEDVVIFEDDVRMVQSLSDLQFDDYDIIWFGYRRGKLENKNKRITGTQAFYLKKEVLKDLYDNFYNYKRKIHCDHAMSKFCVEFMDKYKITQTKLSYCYEKEHTSLISLDNWETYSKPK